MTSTSSGGLRVRHVRASERASLLELRLASLATDPHAFGSTYARDAARPAGWWERRAAESEAGTSQRTFVLVAGDDRWLGLALVRINHERPGSAVLYGMWVAPEVRGRRGAGLLCDACAVWAAERGSDELTLAVVADTARHAVPTRPLASPSRESPHRHTTGAPSTRSS